MKMITNAIVTY